MWQEWTGCCRRAARSWPVVVPCPLPHNGENTMVVRDCLRECRGGGGALRQLGVKCPLCVVVGILVVGYTPHIYE